MTRALADLGEAPFRARQVWHWLYFRGVTDFAAMTTLARPLREKLARHFRLDRPDTVLRQDSADGTRKWLLRFADGNQAEAVFIPEEDRGALCVSSQVGCTLTCRFCHTGTQRLVRNLSAGEIVGQFLLARDSYGEWPTPRGQRLISNIVLMGMGEPLFNYDNVAAALRILMDPEGIAISRRRITLSTAGVVPMIRRAGAELGVKLAVSLHAATDDVRDALVPLNKKYPIAELLQACREYPGADNARRITFEYVMLKGVNDSRGRRQGAGEAGCRHPVQVQPHPVQRLAGGAVRMCRRRGDGAVRGDPERGRLYRADPHAARPRHHGRLRPAQIGERARAAEAVAGAVRGGPW